MIINWFFDKIFRYIIVECLFFVNGIGNWRLRLNGLFGLFWLNFFGVFFIVE